MDNGLKLKNNTSVTNRNSRVTIYNPHYGKRCYSDCFFKDAYDICFYTKECCIKKGSKTAEF